MIEPFIPPVAAEATVPTIEWQEIVNAILYVLLTEYSWRQMPHDLPNGKTAHHSFRIWNQQGAWEPIMTHLRKRVRVENGRDPEPGDAIIDIYRHWLSKQYRFAGQVQQALEVEQRRFQAHSYDLAHTSHEAPDRSFYGNGDGRSARADQARGSGHSAAD